MYIYICAMSDIYMYTYICAVSDIYMYIYVYIYVYIYMYRASRLIQYLKQSVWNRVSETERECLKQSIWNKVSERGCLEQSIWNRYRVTEREYLKQSVWNTVSETECLKQSIWNRVSERQSLTHRTCADSAFQDASRYLKQSIWNKVSETEYLKQSIWNRVSETEYLRHSVSNRMCDASEICRLCIRRRDASDTLHTLCIYSLFALTPTSSFATAYSRRRRRHSACHPKPLTLTHPLNSHSLFATLPPEPPTLSPVTQPLKPDSHFASVYSRKRRRHSVCHPKPLTLKLNPSPWPLNCTPYLILCNSVLEEATQTLCAPRLVIDNECPQTWHAHLPQQLIFVVT